MIDILLVPEIACVINNYLTDEDKLSLLASTKRAYGAAGLCIDRYLCIEDIYGTRIFESSIEIKVIWVDACYDIQIGNNISEIEFLGDYDDDLHMYIENLPKHVRVKVFMYELQCEKLSERITALTFDCEFDQKTRIPKSVTSLGLIGDHSFPIDGIITDSVTTLELGFRYCYPIKDTVPKSVKTLVLRNAHYDKELPESIATLILNSFSFETLNRLVLPKNLKCLKVHKDVWKGTVPNGVTLEFI